MTPSDTLLFKRALVQGWRYRWMILFSLVSSAATGALMGYLLTQLGPFITYLGHTQGSSNDATQLHEATGNLQVMGVKLLVLAPLMGLVAYLSWWSGQWVANSTMRDLRDRALSHLMRLDLAFHAQLTRGEMLTRLTSDLGSALKLQQVTYGKLFQRPLESVGILAFVSWQDWRMGVAMLLFLAPMVAILVPLMRRTRKRGIKARDTLAANFSVLEQITGGLKLVKAMGSAEHEDARYADANRRLFNDNMRLVRARALSDGISAGAVFAISGAGIAIGGWMFAQRWVDPAALFLGIGALARLITTFREVVRSWGDIQEQLPSVARIYGLLDRKSAIQDKPGAQPCPTPRESIRIENVFFRYLADNEDVLRDVSITIPIGKTVALVGQSGAGKSTLLDLLPRFHDVTGGRITFDGVDIREVQANSLAQHFAIVQQDNFLFNDTIYRNILYGRPTATREEVEQAAKRAYVHDVILALEGGQGYETVVGDRGSRLSGGQRQRVAIARALLRNSPILLLDEPTSALDADSERHVHEALDELMRDRTTVVIAHRLATVQHADVIHVLAGATMRDGRPDPRRGTIIESGTHAALIAKGGEYAELVRLQQLHA